MKRYSMNAIGEARPNALGLWAEYSEVHALLRAVAEKVGKVRHEHQCLAHKSVSSGPFASKWFIDDSLCNCPRGRAMALLEVKHGD